MTVPASSPDLSVVICTHNRSAVLRRALRSLAEQTAAPGTFEVIVVDNASRDDTAEVTAAMEPAVPGLRYLYEPELGLCRARNSGTDAARAPLVAFLDDDATTEPGWVTAMVGAFDSPEVAAAGGPIVVEWEQGDRPRWLPRTLDPQYGHLDCGPESVPMVFPVTPFGSSMVFRREVLFDVGGFSMALSRKGNGLISNDEKEVFRRLADRGLTVRYVPDAVVHHHIPAERSTVRWLSRRRYAQGRSVYRQATLAAPLSGRERARVLAAAGSRIALASALAVAGAGAGLVRGGGVVDRVVPHLFRIPLQAGRIREAVAPIPPEEGDAEPAPVGAGGSRP
jgi:glycosyltransferase involved in cell wall biosynthesis